MAYDNKIATIFGGTGFVGRQIVRELAGLGYTVKVATRVPESAYFLKPCGAVGQIVPYACNYSDAADIAKAIDGSDVVVHCIGILFESGKKSKFQKVHIDLPAMIAKACADNGVERFVHISALGCDRSQSKYGKSKFEGEQAVLENCSNAIILRPSIIFGEDDNFFNMFAELSRYLPFLPLIGGGKTKFQPVFVGDVADCAVKALDTKSDKYTGKTFELGGPDVATFKELYELMFKFTGRERRLLPLPYPVAKVQASFMGLMPKPLLTRDQVESLKTDNVVQIGMPNISDFGIEPKSMDLILPMYLKRYRAGGRFGLVKEH